MSSVSAAVAVVKGGLGSARCQQQQQQQQRKKGGEGVFVGGHVTQPFRKTRPTTQKNLQLQLLKANDSSCSCPSSLATTSYSPLESFDPDQQLFVLLFADDHKRRQFSGAFREGKNCFDKKNLGLPKCLLTSLGLFKECRCRFHPSVRYSLIWKNYIELALQPNFPA